MRRLMTMVGAGLALAAGAVVDAGKAVTNQLVEPADRRERRRARRERSKTRFRPRWARWSRYRPHQGKQEVARRARQISAGKLEVSRG